MPFCSFSEGAAMFDVTPIENMFLLEYLPTAPDGYLRVYLYARMLCLHPEVGGELKDMAKALHMEEEAVFNAFSYWERMGLVERLRPAAVVVVDALAAMETSHICTTVQLTDTGIQPGSGVGNHRAALCEATLHVPVVAMGIPMVVYASTIVRDALKRILSRESGEEAAEAMAEELAGNAVSEMVVTPRDIDELVAGLSDMLALAINAALQPGCSMEELSHYLH